MMPKQRPEALATFAESARKQQEEGKQERKPLDADAHTVPVPEDNEVKHDTATELLNEGATGREDERDGAIHRTKDRIRDSR